MKDRVNKKRTENFTTTSNKILQDCRLSYEAIGVFMYLWSMPDDWQVIVKQVIKHNNSSEYSVRKAMRELRQYGYMKWKRMQGYFEYDMCENGSFHYSDIQHNESHYSDIQHNDIYIQNNNINKTKTNTNTASGFSNKKEISVVKENLITESVEVKIAEKKNIDLFEAFWKAYPKKKAKEKARQVFEKLLSKAKNKEILAEQIMKGLELYNQDITQKQTKEEFIAHATTWLNQARWEDEYETPQQNKINLSGQKLIQKPVYKVSEEDKKKQEQELKEYEKVKTEEPEFMEHFKSVLKNYFGSSHFSWIQSLKIKSTNENEVVFILPYQIYVDTINRNKEKFEQVFNREFQGFDKEFTGKIKFVAWKI